MTPIEETYRFHSDSVSCAHSSLSSNVSKRVWYLFERLRPPSVELQPSMALRPIWHWCNFRTTISMISINEGQLTCIITHAMMLGEILVIPCFLAFPHASCEASNLRADVGPVSKARPTWEELVNKIILLNEILTRKRRWPLQKPERGFEESNDS